MVTAQVDDGVTVTRNCSFFKSVPAAAAEEIRKDPANVTSPPDTTDGGPDTTGAPMQSDAAPWRCYPQCMRTRPVKLDDYVCG